VKYQVFYTYSPRYNRERILANQLGWEWSRPPETWEDYEQVRIYLAKEHSAIYVMLYAVIPVEALKKYRGVKNYLYQNGTRKTGADKPWEDHAEANR